VEFLFGPAAAWQRVPPLAHLIQWATTGQHQTCSYSHGIPNCPERQSKPCILYQDVMGAVTLHRLHDRDGYRVAAGEKQDKSKND
jgi:hypothetical protein